MELPGGDRATDTPHRRGLLARIGVTALNLLGAGLGLLRIGDRRLALITLACSVGFPLLLALFYAFGPELTFAYFAGVIAASVLYLLVVELGAIILTFRRSHMVAEPQDRWSRWPVVLAATILSVAASYAIGSANEAAYRNFSIPSDSMQPTLRPGDRLVAKVGAAQAIRRGDVLIVKNGEFDFVERVVGLPGEMVSLSRGTVYIDGKPLPQRSETVDLPTGACEVFDDPTVLREIPQPGAPGYLTLDCSVTSADDFPPTRVPASHFFVLGDNRDRSADSRFDKKQLGMGLGMVPRRDIVARGLFLYWSADRDRIGLSLR